MASWGPERAPSWVVMAGAAFFEALAVEVPSEELAEAVPFEALVAAPFSEAAAAAQPC